MPDLSLLSQRELMDLVVNYKKYGYSINHVREAIAELTSRGGESDELKTISLQVGIDRQSENHKMDVIKDNMRSLFRYALAGIIISLLPLPLLYFFVICQIEYMKNPMVDSYSYAAMALAFSLVVIMMLSLLWNSCSLVKADPMLEECMAEDRMGWVLVVKRLGIFFGSFLLLFLLLKLKRDERQGWS